MTGKKDLSGYCLSERYDLSGHDNSDPHLNQDVIHINTGINAVHSGKSQKNADGFKGLGMAHHIRLFDDD